MKILTLSILSLFSFKSFGQNSFGVEFGTTFYTFTGVNDLDSIRVGMNGTDWGEGFGGVFYDVQLTSKFSIHNKLLIRPILLDYSVYNYQAQCLFCNVRKGTVIGVTNISLEVLPQVVVLKNMRFKIKIFGGLNSSFNFTSENRDISFNGRNPGVALVLNSLDEVVRPVTFSYIYGASIEYSRFIFWWKYQTNSRFSDTINVSGTEYEFKNNWEFLTLSIGYRLYSLRLKKNRDDGG